MFYVLAFVGIVLVAILFRTIGHYRAGKAMEASVKHALFLMLVRLDKDLASYGAGADTKLLAPAVLSLLTTTDLRDDASKGYLNTNRDRIAGITKQVLIADSELRTLAVQTQLWLYGGRVAHGNRVAAEALLNNLYLKPYENERSLSPAEYFRMVSEFSSQWLQGPPVSTSEGASPPDVFVVREEGLFAIDALGTLRQVSKGTALSPGPPDGDALAEPSRNAERDKIPPEVADEIPRLEVPDAFLRFISGPGFSSMLDTEIRKSPELPFSLEAIDFKNCPESVRKDSVFLSAVANNLLSGNRLGDVVAFRAAVSEFIVLCLGRSKQDASQIAHLRCHALARALRGGYPELKVCIGVVVWPDDGRTQSELLDSLTDAMQLAKNSEQGGIAVAKVGMLPVARIRVLVVDDEPEIVAVLESQLRVEGCEVTSCVQKDVGSALRILRSCQSKKFDVAVLGIVMPGIDGREMARYIGALLPGTRIVMNSTSREIGREMVRLGEADAFVPRPFEMEEMRAALWPRF